MATASVDAMEPKDVLRSKAYEVMEKVDCDIEKALRNYRRWLDVNGDLREEMVKPLIDTAIHTLLSEARRRLRKGVWYDNRAEPGESDSGLVAVAAKRTRELMDFYLGWSRTTLGEATRAQVSVEAEEYGRLETSNGVKHRWLALIAERMTGETQKVKNAMKEDDLVSLQEQAKG